MIIYDHQEFVCGLARSLSVVCDHRITKLYFFFSLALLIFLFFGFVPSLLCRGDCVRERCCVLPVLSCNSSVEVPLWKVLYGHSKNSSV